MLVLGLRCQVKQTAQSCVKATYSPNPSAKHYEQHTVDLIAVLKLDDLILQFDSVKSNS